MRRIHAAHLPAHAGETVTVAGWVHRRRLLKQITFLVVRDATGDVQAVVTEPAVRAYVARQLTEQTVVRVSGRAAAQPAAPGGVELVDPQIEVLGDPAAPPPFDLYRPALSASLPTQLDHAPLSLRHPSRSAALRVAAAATAGFREALTARGFVEVHTPKVVAAATESGADVFEVDWFGRPAYLAQSPQFYKQLMVGVFERVFEVGPVFRAEPHDTARHLAQYTSLDVELGFICDHRDVMVLLRDTLAGMVGSVFDQAGRAAATLGLGRLSVPAQIPALHFTEALQLCQAPPDTVDLAPAMERAVGAWAAREHGSDFVFVTGYPMAKRPFYTHPDPRRPAYSNSFDLLFRGMELVTGGQRRHRYEDYVVALRQAGEPLAPYDWFIEAFRHGMPPHGGFAIGLERFVAQLVGAGNVRAVTAFPRDLHRLTP